MEYLFLKSYMSGIPDRFDFEWTDQMKAFLCETLQKKPASEQLKAFLWKMIQHCVMTRRPIPFDAKAVDLSGYRPQLRSTLTSNLQDKDVLSMLRRLDYYDSRNHETGKGIAHLYEPFEKNGEKGIFDHFTGLMWQKSGSVQHVTYAEAENYVRDLNRRGFAGYNDWRLPTLEEAMSLTEVNNSGELCVSREFCKEQQRRIWTADKKSTDSAWVVNFILGYCIYERVDTITLYVRAVR
jgi:hypothetical protein